MKFLGRGWQYTTYDLGNGRVRKTYNSPLTGYIHMFVECFPFTRDSLFDLPGFYTGCKAFALASMKEVKNSPLEPWMMGNPTVLNELDYEQDKLLPLHQYLKEVDTSTGKKVIDEFIEFNKLLVSKSLIDKGFHIAKNFALDTNGRVVLMDLGELHSDQEKIRRQIVDRAWSKYYITDPIPEPLREYFVSSMDAAFTK